MKDQKDKISEIDKLIYALNKLERSSEEETKKKEFARIRQKLIDKKNNLKNNSKWAINKIK